ncbi:MAG: thiolase family protein [Pseudobdellovibrionaceae bacterium]|nr:thiolase family protein [Bdellovibrionales bacterium]USN48307.1 MAG: thiolase family protein [Pseudobdellovibrionaceae bacterium]
MSSERDVVIVDGVRTPFAKAGADLRDVHAAELGSVALKELLARTDLDVSEVDEVIIGNTGNPSDAVNISRVVALRSGIPQKTSAFTVHRNCASALESVATGYDKIRSGTVDTVVAGGTESMSQLPLLFSKKFADVFGEFVYAKTVGQKLSALKKMKLNYLKPRISVMEGLTDPFVGINMGQTAEILAKEFGLTREMQDQFAVESHLKAVKAMEEGRLKDEITPVFLAPKYKKIVADDVGPRKGQSMQQLGKLKPFFDKRYGTITAGNACPITDGAAMLLLMSRKRANELGYKPLAKIRSYAFAGLEPERMGLGPAYATPLALKRAGLTLKDMDLIELNEAFAAQVMACEKAFASDQFAKEKLGLGSAVGEIDPSKLNVNGGAIALGHPVGATGTRLVLTLIREMMRSDKQFGLATLCIGGGQGGAMIVEREA